MTDLRSRIEVLRGRSPLDAAKVVLKKFVYRKVALDRLGMRAGDTVVPERPCAFPIELWGPDRYGSVIDHHPYLSEEDLADFRRQESICIVVLDGERIAANSWMTKGEVYVHELQRPLHVGPSEHFSCRSYVDPDYRGHALFGHMVAAYSHSVPPDDEVWGLVYAWNTASLLTLERLGWRTTGECWTRFVFGRKVAGERRFSARLPTLTGAPR